MSLCFRIRSLHLDLAGLYLDTYHPECWHVKFIIVTQTQHKRELQLDAVVLEQYISDRKVASIECLNHNPSATQMPGLNW